MTPDELNELLAKTRDQKFRKKTENEIDAQLVRNQTLKQVCSTADFSQKSTNSNKRTWNDPEARARRIEGINRAWADQETYNKRVEGIRKTSQRPDVREKNLKNIMERARPIRDLENNITHESLIACARYYNKAVGTIQYWIKTSKKDKFFYYEDNI
jgi:hypothetical protein